MAALAQRRDAVALEARQIPAVVLLGDQLGRHPAILLSPTKPGLTSDPQLPTDLHRPHAGGK
jgi:hypothetical protein